MRFFLSIILMGFLGWWVEMALLGLGLGSHRFSGNAFNEGIGGLILAIPSAIVFGPILAVLYRRRRTLEFIVFGVIYLGFAALLNADQ